MENAKHHLHYSPCLLAWIKEGGFCMGMSYFSAHHADIASKSATGKIVLPEPAELCCSCKRIPSYEGDAKRSNVSMCPMQDTEI
ncbi:hypothetical protein AVEN_119289-1 [Araneus ventricosus]|uniref:Uncharacterized protein n=1 Tax=Araneus ventricosus TaxID=182803 RepID=A0A4Y2EFA4_ARAVE|nr:hypothetical protein AVEN_119289-1 [Araneus ventricosus]